MHCDVILKMPQKQPAVAEISRATGSHFLDPATEHLSGGRNGENEIHAE